MQKYVKFVLILVFKLLAYVFFYIKIVGKTVEYWRN